MLLKHLLNIFNIWSKLAALSQRYKQFINSERRLLFWTLQTSLCFLMLILRWCSWCVRRLDSPLPNQGETLCSRDVWKWLGWMLIELIPERMQAQSPQMSSDSRLWLHRAEMLAGLPLLPSCLAQLQCQPSAAPALPAAPSASSRLLVLLCSDVPVSPVAPLTALLHHPSATPGPRLCHPACPVPALRSLPCHTSAWPSTAAPWLLSVCFPKSSWRPKP